MNFIIPVLQRIDFYSDVVDNFQSIKTKKRTCKQVETLIEKIHTEIVNAQMNGFEPTYVILSWEDSAFLTAYARYKRPSYLFIPHGLNWNEVVTEVMGLKIIVSNVRKPKVGW